MYLHGRNVLKEILNLNYDLKIKRVIFTDQKNIDTALINLKKRTENRYRVDVLSPQKLYDLSREKKHQGVVIELREFPFCNFEEILHQNKEKKNSLLVLLDQVQDPHNFGAIIRSSVACGADGIIITERASSDVSPAVIKVSAGLAFSIKISKVTNLRNAMKIIKENGYWIYSAAMNGKSYFDEIIQERSALIFGNEGQGVRRLIKESSDEIISIPIKKEVDSLNVAASAAVLLFEYSRQMYKKN